MNIKSYHIFYTKAKAELPLYNHLPSISQHFKHNDYKLGKARGKKKENCIFIMTCIALDEYIGMSRKVLT